MCAVCASHVVSCKCVALCACACDCACGRVCVCFFSLPNVLPSSQITAPTTDFLEGKAVQAFDLADHDGSGQISLTEMVQYAHKVPQAANFLKCVSLVSVGVGVGVAVFFIVHVWTLAVNLPSTHAFALTLGGVGGAASVAK